MPIAYFTTGVCYGWWWLLAPSVKVINHSFVAMIIILLPQGMAEPSLELLALGHVIFTLRSSSLHFQIINTKL